MKKRRILVTSALPNANGSIHLGHLMEHIQTDIWVRFQRSIGNECIFVCADDTHGTAIMLRADEKSISPETLIEKKGKKFVKLNISKRYITLAPVSNLVGVAFKLSDPNGLLEKGKEGITLALLELIIIISFVFQILENIYPFIYSSSFKLLTLIPFSLTKIFLTLKRSWVIWVA